MPKDNLFKKDWYPAVACIAAFTHSGPETGIKAIKKHKSLIRFFARVTKIIDNNTEEKAIKLLCDEGFNKRSAKSFYHEFQCEFEILDEKDEKERKKLKKQKRKRRKVKKNGKNR